MIDITKNHADYDKNVNNWIKYRDFYNGVDTVKNKGDVYFTRSTFHIDSFQKRRSLVDHDVLENKKLVYGEDNFKEYIKRAIFLDKVKEVVEYGVANINRNPFTIESNSNIEYLDYLNESIKNLTKKLISELMLIGRCGLLVDISNDDKPLPYIALYNAESIVNWSNDYINGQNVLTSVVLKEVKREIIEDELVDVEYYRHLKVVDGIYTQELYKKVKDSVELIDTIQPMYIGKYFDKIPFVIVGSNNCESNIDKSPVRNVVGGVHSYLINSADFQETLRISGSPTLILSGVNQDEIFSDMKIGTGYIHAFEGPNTKMEYIEMKGSTLEIKERNLLNIEKQIEYEIGSIFSTSGVQSAESLKIKLSQGTVKLSNISNNVASGFEFILRCIQGLFTDNVDIRIDSNQKFIDDSVVGLDVEKAADMYLKGALPVEHYAEILIKNKRVGINVIKEQLIEDLLNIGSE